MSDLEGKVRDLERKVIDLQNSVRNLEWKCCNDRSTCGIDSAESSEQTAESSAINSLGEMLSAQNAQPANAAPTGACVYQAGTGVHCAVLTKAQCDVLHGSWYQGQQCPRTADEDSGSTEGLLLGFDIDYCGKKCPDCGRACAKQKDHSGKHKDLKSHEW
jgi:hypothetical protein